MGNTSPSALRLGTLFFATFPPRPAPFSATIVRPPSASSTLFPPPLFSTDRAVAKRTVSASHRGAVTCLLTPEHGNLVVSAGTDRKLRIWTSDLDPIRTIQMPQSTNVVAIDPTGDCLIFNGESGLQAFHLSFARSLLDTDLSSSAGSHAALRYLALGRADWCLKALAPGGSSGISHASLARAFWQKGRFADAAAEFSRQGKLG